MRERTYFLLQKVFGLVTLMLFTTTDLVSPLPLGSVLLSPSLSALAHAYTAQIEAEGIHLIPLPGGDATGPY